MKKLFKLSFASLLMASLVFASSCYKKDIDDLEKRVDALERKVNTNEEAIAQLQVDLGVLGSKVFVTNVTASTTTNTLTITYSNNTSTTIPYFVPTIPNIPAAPGTAIVKSYTDAGNYYEIQIWEDGNKTGASDVYYVIRMGKNFSTANAYGVSFAVNTVEAELGEIAYALVDVNPSGFELTLENVTFDLAIALSRAASGLSPGVELISVTRSTEFADFADIFEGISALAGRWVLEFEFNEFIVEEEPYSMLVEFPANGNDFNGIWKSTVGLPPANPTVTMQYTMSSNSVWINTEMVDVPEEDVLVIETTEESATPAVAGAYTMFSDETYESVISIDTDVFSSSPGYLSNPTVEVQTIYWDHWSINPPIEITEATFPTERAAVLSYIKTVLSVPTDGVTAEDFRNLEIYFAGDFNETIWPAGWALVYEVVVTAQTPDGETVSNTLTIRAIRLLSENTVEYPIGAFYIPLPTEATKELAVYTWAAAGDAIYDAVIGVTTDPRSGMGFTAAQLATAEFEGLTVEVWDGTEWVASTAPFTAAEDNDELTVSVANTVPVGLYRLGYKFNIDGRDVIIYDEAQVVAPTISLRLKDATIDALVEDNVPTSSLPVTAIVATVDTPDDVIEVADLLNLFAGNVELVATAPLGAPASGYTYDLSIPTLAGNTTGIAAMIEEVGIDEDGYAINVKLFVQLSTGQTLPVMVSYSDGTPVSFWTNGNFFVLVQPNELTAIVTEDPVAPFSLGAVIAEPVDITEVLLSATFVGLPYTVTTDIEGTAYANLLADPRIASVEFIPGTIPAGQDLDEIDTLFTIETGVNSTGEPVVLLQGVNNGLAAWGLGVIKVQNLTVIVTDVFGNEEESTVTIQFTHNEG
ncbi:MAG: hypothetical protein FWE10_03590 [Rikenellaceae bacterium]|nr:hypothetical protein [Rikenellaceae bacterium]MCL2693031.1 hypothetical protein [Rikenellaceae bacterium]